MEKLFSPTLILGASGLVGSFITKSLKGSVDITAPTHQELDILDFQQVLKYLDKSPSEVVINFIAHTNLNEAEKERGDKSGLVWKLNVSAVETLAKTCQQNGKFLIHISTDNVFPGTKDFPGPYPEDTTPPDNPKPLCWYGYTKLKGEQVLKEASTNSAIIRISHPFGNLLSKKDFASKVIDYVKLGYVLFDDQHFTPTYLADLSSSILKILAARQAGIFHVVCNEITTPFQFAKYVAANKKLEEEIKLGKIDDWAKQNPNSYSKLRFGGLDNKATQSKLGVQFHTWQQALKEFLPNL